MNSERNNELNFHSTDKWLQWIDELAESDYVVIDDFLPDYVFKELLILIENHKSDFERAGIGSNKENQIWASVRGDLTYWLSPHANSEFSAIWGLIDETMGMLNRYCYLSLSGKEFHLVHYPKGTWYKKHVDQFADRNNRLISMICYLNNDWNKEDGGKLKIYLSNEESIYVEPIAKRCVLFKSAAIPHSVQEVHKSRYSLTGWFTYMPNTLNGTLIPT
jgi:SM-20-related protein